MPKSKSNQHHHSQHDASRQTYIILSFRDWQYVVFCNTHTRIHSYAFYTFSCKVSCKVFNILASLATTFAFILFVFSRYFEKKGIKQKKKKRLLIYFILPKLFFNSFWTFAIPHQQLSNNTTTSSSSSKSFYTQINFLKCFYLEKFVVVAVVVVCSWTS